MATITTKDNKNVTMTKDILVDGKVVKTISATISENGHSISFSTDYVYDLPLYKANRAAIRKIEYDFEDEAFTLQDEMAKANVNTDENTSDK